MTEHSGEAFVPLPDGRTIPVSWHGSWPGGNHEADAGLDIDGDRDIAETAVDLGARSDHDVGRAILFPTDVQPHLCCAKAKKGQALQAENGVSFLRVGEDCHVYASDNRVWFRLVLKGDGPLVPPQGAVVPMKAMHLVSQSMAEQVAIWLGKGKVRIRDAGEQYDFRLIEVLPFPDDRRDLFRDVETAAHRVKDCRVSAYQLARLQRALGAQWVELVQKKRGVVLVLPNGVEADPLAAGDRLGAMELRSSIEGEDEKKAED